MTKITPQKIHRDNALINDPVVGIDTSLCSSGVCVLQGSDVYFYLIKTRKLRGAKRLSYIADALDAILDDYKSIALAAVEDGAYDAGGHIFQLGQVQGLAQVALFRRRIDLIEISPTRLKKFFANHGGASKRKMVQVADDVLGTYKLQNDLADAFALASLAETFIAKKPRTRKQAEVILDIDVEKAT